MSDENHPRQIKKEQMTQSLRKLLSHGVAGINPDVAIFRTNNNVASGAVQDALQEQASGTSLESEIFPQLLDALRTALSNHDLHWLNELTSNIGKCSDPLTRASKQVHYHHIAAKEDWRLSFKTKGYSAEELTVLLGDYIQLAKRENAALLGDIQFLYKKLEEVQADMSFMHASLLSVRKLMRNVNKIGLESEIEYNVENTQEAVASDVKTNTPDASAANDNHGRRAASSAQAASVLENAFTLMQRTTKQVAEQIYQVNDYLVQAMNDLADIATAMRPSLLAKQPAFMQLEQGVAALFEAVLKDAQGFRSETAAQHEELVQLLQQATNSLSAADASVLEQSFDLKQLIKLLKTPKSEAQSSNFSAQDITLLITQLQQLYREKIEEEHQSSAASSSTTQETVEESYVTKHLELV